MRIIPINITEYFCRDLYWTRTYRLLAEVQLWAEEHSLQLEGIVVGQQYIQDSMLLAVQLQRGQ